MAVTIQEIAERLNLSPGAVSQILRSPKHPRFAPETRQRVLHQADEMGYVQNRLAGGLRGGRTHMLSLVTPWNIVELMDVAEAEARRSGYCMMVNIAPLPDADAERRVVQSVLERRVDGLIWMPGNSAEIDGNLARQIRQSNTRTVLLEEGLATVPGADLIRFSYERVCDELVGHLAEQEYERLCFVTHDRVHGVTRRQIADALSRAGQARGLPVDIIQTADHRNATSVDPTVFRTARSSPVAVVCDNDFYAMDVLNLARQNGLRIPGEIGLVAFGDLLLGGRFPFGELASPSITTVPRRYREMAHHAVDRMISGLDKERDEEALEIDLPLGLRVRESTSRRTAHHRQGRSDCDA